MIEFRYTLGRKYLFPSLRKSKLQQRGDVHFQEVKRINGNAYKLDLHGEYNVRATFNVNSLSSIVGDESLNSRTNSLKDEKYNKDQRTNYNSQKMDIKRVCGPMTRAIMDKLRENLEEQISLYLDAKIISHYLTLVLLNFNL